MSPRYVSHNNNGCYQEDRKVIEAEPRGTRYGIAICLAFDRDIGVEKGSKNSRLVLISERGIDSASFWKDKRCNAQQSTEIVNSLHGSWVILMIVSRDAVLGHLGLARVTPTAELRLFRPHLQLLL